MSLQEKEMIRKVTFDDIQQICDIYNHYIQNTIITFEESPVSYKEMKKRIVEITSSLPFFVYTENEEIIGYTYASKWKGRSGYRFSVETSVYLKNGQLGKGIGTKLYTALLNDLRKRNIHAVIGVIALPNQESQHLHEKFGFKKVAHFTEIGYKFNQWIDVGYWELLLK
jgi:L-amino acid N-acyltransferase YncA